MPLNAAERDVAARTRLSGCEATTAAVAAGAAVRWLAVVAAGAADAGGGGGGCLPAVEPRVGAGLLTVAARDVAC